jgi:hypothetical protein
MQVVITFKGHRLVCIGDYEPEFRSNDYWYPESWTTNEIWLDGEIDVTDLLEDYLQEIDHLCLAEV